MLKVSSVHFHDGSTYQLATIAANETVIFSTSLYRKNLHYAVLPKPSSGTQSIEKMRDYILTHHPHDTGIVYCLTKKVCFLLSSHCVPATHHTNRIATPSPKNSNS